MRQGHMYVWLQIQIWHNWRTNSWAACVCFSVWYRIRGENVHWQKGQPTKPRSIMGTQCHVRLRICCLGGGQSQNHDYIFCLSCGILSHLHCCLPLRRSFTTPLDLHWLVCTHMSRQCLSVPAGHTQHQVTRWSHRDTRNVLEVGHMFPQWLFLDGDSWYELNYKHALALQQRLKCSELGGQLSHTELYGMKVTF